MPSPMTNVLLALETQKAVPVPMAALVLGAVSQVEVLTELVDRVCDRYFDTPSRRQLIAVNFVPPKGRPSSCARA